MFRYFAELAYNGTHYHGWQVQANADSVQATLDKALSTLLRTTVKTVGSSRTDTGVHAEQQFAHFDLPFELPEHIYPNKINAILPHDISVNAFYKVHGGLHARYDAVSRSYEYRICRKKDPFLHKKSLLLTRPLNLPAMRETAEVLKKYTDFEAFGKTDPSKEHHLCTIFKTEWIEKEHLLIFYIKANRFLRGMVRTLVGTMLAVGKEKISSGQFEEIIRSKDRKTAGEAVAPEGLFLTRVEYPEGVLEKIRC